MIIEYETCIFKHTIAFPGRCIKSKRMSIHALKEVLAIQNERDLWPGYLTAISLFALLGWLLYVIFKFTYGGQGRVPMMKNPPGPPSYK